MEKIEVEVSHIVTAENLHRSFAGSRWMEVGALWDVSFAFSEQEKIGQNFCQYHHQFIFIFVISNKGSINN